MFGCDTRDAEQTYFIRSNAGLVFQNPDDQLVASLIENDVAFGPENLGIPNPELRERVTRALAEVGLHRLRDARDQRALGRPEAARGHRRGARHGSGHPHSGRGHGHARPARTRRAHARRARAARARHDRRDDHPLHGGGGLQPTAWWCSTAARCAWTALPEEVLVRADELRTLSLEVPFACRLSLELQAAGVPVSTCIADDALKEELCALRSKM